MVALKQQLLQEVNSLHRVAILKRLLLQVPSNLLRQEVTPKLHLQETTNSLHLQAAIHKRHLQVSSKPLQEAILKPQLRLEANKLHRQEVTLKLLLH